MKTTIILVLCGLLGGCATTDAMRIADSFITFINHKGNAP
jgi:hypothetical protein